MFIYNTEYWTQAGLDPTAVPTSWDEMYAFTPEARPRSTAARSRRTPRPITNQGDSYWLCYYNSFNLPFLSDDKTQVLFDNDQGKATWDCHQQGLHVEVLRAPAGSTPHRTSTAT